jgi:hypothetical protein
MSSKLGNIQYDYSEESHKRSQRTTRMRDLLLGSRDQHRQFCNVYLLHKCVRAGPSYHIHVWGSRPRPFPENLSAGIGFHRRSCTDAVHWDYSAALPTRCASHHHFEHLLWSLFCPTQLVLTSTGQTSSGSSAAGVG